MTRAEEQFEKLREALHEQLSEHMTQLIEDFIFACIKVERENQK